MKRMIVLCVMLTGCVTAPPITLPQAESNCGQVAFSDYGGCIRQQFDAQYPAWRSNSEADLAEVYVTWLEAAGERIRRNEMTESAAKMDALTLRTRLYEIVSQRRNAAALNNQVNVMTLLTGLALINAATPQPVQSPQIICNSNTYAGNTTTICR